MSCPNNSRRSGSIRLRALGAAVVACSLFLPAMARAQNGGSSDTPPPRTGDKTADAAETTETVYKDWRIICPVSENGPLAICVMAPRIVSDEQAQAPIKMALELHGEGRKEQALVIFSTPQDTLLPAGVVFQVDSRRGVKVPFRSCSNNGCLAPFNPDRSVMDGFLRGLDLKVASLALDGSQRTTEVSLRGFTAAMRALRESLNGKPSSN